MLQTDTERQIELDQIFGRVEARLRVGWARDRRRRLAAEGVEGVYWSDEEE